jgi:hypothetical protein
VPVQVDPDYVPPRRMLPPSWASLAWWRRMHCTFQHPPGAEARS